MQFYGTTLGGAIADNNVSNVNVHTIYDSINGASVRASGLCYYGAQPTFFTEITGNNLHASDGVGFFNEVCFLSARLSNLFRPIEFLALQGMMVHLAADSFNHLPPPLRPKAATKGW